MYAVNNEIKNFKMVTTIHPNRNASISRNIISKWLFEYLNTNNINYASFGPDDSSLFETNSINIVIPQNDFNFISRHVYQFCGQSNLICVQTLRYETTACLFILSYYDKAIDRFLNIKVDFCSDFKIDARFLLSAEELLNDPSYNIEKKYWKVSSASSFIYYLVRLIENLSINETQFAELNKWWFLTATGITEKLKRFFNGNSISIITDSFRKRDIHFLKANLVPLHEDLHANTQRDKKDIIANRLRLMKNSLKPKGLVIGILGRDGCGKSTFVNEMANSLGTYFTGTATFKKLPAILYKGEIFKKKEEYIFSKPHHHDERGTFASFLKLNLLLIEFLLGYWLKIFPAKVKSQLVLYDRYFVDVLADPRRYRIKHNKFFVKIYHYILPKPDLWIILDLPSEILLKRKQELSFEMAEKLRYEYLNLQKFLPNSIVINNEEDIRKTVNKASTFIFNYMHQRVAV